MSKQNPSHSAAATDLSGGFTGPSRYVVFDLLRGLAAVIVLVFHAGYMFGDFAPALPKGYLAVDFFFILSGFVISANYHVSVRPAISWRDFLVARAARLWPLFFVATLIGAVAIVAKLARDAGYFDAGGVFGSLALNVFMLPSFMAPYGVDRIFLFNGASWSVFFEVVVNLLFFAVLRKLRLSALLGLSVVFGGLLVAAAATQGDLDGGWAAANFHVGSARVLFGFCAGMAIQQWTQGFVHKQNPRRLSAVATLLLAFVFCGSFALAGDWWVDCVLVLVVFPALVLAMAQCDLAGRTAKAGRFIGDISYSVYLLQTPAMLFVSGAFEFAVGRKIAEYAPVSGVLFVLAMLGGSYLSWRYFELPARNGMRRWLGGTRRSAYTVREELA